MSAPATDTKSRAQAAILEALDDARHRLDISYRDIAPDFEDWDRCAGMLTALMVAAYLRSHHVGEA